MWTSTWKKERERQVVNVNDYIWTDASCTTSASVVSFTPRLSCPVAARLPSASSFLLKWESPLVCCCAYTNKCIDQESLKVTDQRVSETWTKSPSQQWQKGDEGRSTSWAPFCKSVQVAWDKTINSYGEQKPQQQQQQEGADESPPLSRDLQAKPRLPEHEMKAFDSGCGRSCHVCRVTQCLHILMTSHPLLAPAGPQTNTFGHSGRDKRTEQFKFMLASFTRKRDTTKSTEFIKGIIRSEQGTWNSSLPAQLRNILRQ